MTNPDNSIFKLITDSSHGKWMNVAAPVARKTPIDLLFKTDGKPAKLIEIEFQSCNDPLLPSRMAEHARGIYELYGQYPEQYVLYVGNDRICMPSEYAGPDFACRYKIFDIRTLNAESLMDSPFIADSVMAILAGYTDPRATIQRILAQIVALGGEQRRIAFSNLTILAGLRKLGTAIQKEAKHMPILDDIMDHDLLGPAIRRGRQEGGAAILRGQIAKRFGPISTPHDKRLSQLSLPEIEALSLRILDVKTATELFER